LVKTLKNNVVAYFYALPLKQIGERQTKSWANLQEWPVYTLILESGIQRVKGRRANGCREMFAAAEQTRTFFTQSLYLRTD
jgi:hypothetical protein